MRVEEVHDLTTVLPGPCAENSGAVDIVLAHVVVKQGVEVHVGHAAHRPLQSLHLQLCLIVHLTDQLLTVFELVVELSPLVAVEIGALLNKEVERMVSWPAEQLIQSCKAASSPPHHRCR